ncbi:MAG: anthranilate synthase component I family protein [Gammaproteobacteria bacterium]|nr:anthranilate synthase component I family protein [Gammaproteobacteria bacterium]
MNTAASIAEMRYAAERDYAAAKSFACLVSKRGHPDLGRRSLMASTLALEWHSPVNLSDAKQTTDALRRTASRAFGRGAKGLLVLVTHEASACFDHIAVHDDWLGLPRIQVWSAGAVLRTLGGEAGGCWGPPESPLRVERREDLQSSLLKDWHTQSVERIHEAIASGRLYQLCLTFPVQFAPPKNPAALFAALLAGNPVDHAAWIQLPDFSLLSVSPERFLSVRGREATLRPMKGTRRLDGVSDDRRTRELAESIKDRAENVMIVDLARNDLSRVCVAGSVRAESLFEVERYGRVAQMSSTIRGELREGLDVWDALAAAFPPGSMTGAPKIEACRMIRELEAGPRGLYGGVLGWIEPDGAAEFSVVIRSMQIRGDEARWDIGGGIVHDSKAESEWDEAWAKFSALRNLESI